MKIDRNMKKTDFFDSLYRKAKDNLSEIFEKYDTYYEQYKGSDKIDGSGERASTVLNITYEIIETQVSSEIPAPCVNVGRYSEKRDRNAKSVERLLCRLRDALPFENYNDIDERYTYIYGGSVWFVEWDSGVIVGNERGGVKIHCINPRDFIPEPNVYNIDDMQYCFLRFDTTRADIISEFDLDDERAAALSCDADADGYEDTVTMIVCFYKNEDGMISQFVYSGDTVLSDVDNYYLRKKKVCEKCGKTEGVCRCGGKKALADDEFETLDDDIIQSDGTVIPCMSPVYIDGKPMLESINPVPQAHLEKTKIRYYVPKRFPIVIRKNTSEDKALLGQSDCAFIRCQQQQINKVESRIMQKLMRAGITPIVPDDAEVALNNQIFGQVIKLKPGENSSMYGIIDTTPDISQDIAEADRLYRQAKRIVGISDSYQGFADNSAISGVAKQLQVTQSAGRLESKKRMKHSAYADIDKVIFGYYLAYADEPRCVSYKDCFGRIHNMEFNRYDFIEYDVKNHTYYYDDGYQFSVDVSGGVEQQREYIWQKNLENLRAGTLGDTADSMTLLRYWQAQERAHYPFARDNVEYFLSLAGTLPKTCATAENLTDCYDDASDEKYNMSNAGADNEC